MLQIREIKTNIPKDVNDFIDSFVSKHSEEINKGRLLRYLVKTGLEQCWEKWKEGKQVESKKQDSNSVDVSFKVTEELYGRVGIVDIRVLGNKGAEEVMSFLIQNGSTHLKEDVEEGRTYPLEHIKMIDEILSMEAHEYGVSIEDAKAEENKTVKELNR